jgi:hypothetical protein
LCDACSRSPNDDPEYVSWRDEGCRLTQLSPRHYTAAAAAGSFPDKGTRCGGLKYNTYYQDLVRQKLDQQQADYEREQMKILNDNRQCM